MTPIRTPWAPSLAAVVLGAALLSACGGSSSPAAPGPTPTYTIPASELADMLAEKVMGNAAASVSLIEYSSITCPHCATFQLSTLPALKGPYIDTGKVKVVYRDFPVPGASTTAAAYAAAALARCAGSARYFEALDLLYRAQSSWTSSSNPTSGMKQALAPLGIASDKMDACVASAEIKADIDRVMAEGRSGYGVGGTPTVVINGQVLPGPSYAQIDAVLQTLVK